MIVVVRNEGSSGGGWLVAVSLALLAACSSKPLTSMTGAASAAGTAGTAGGSGVAGVAGTGGVTGTAGAGATGATGGGGDAAPRCATTNDRASVAVHLADGRTLGCASSFDAGFEDAGAGPMTFEAKIVSGDQTTLVFDSGAQIEIVAPGLDLSNVPHLSVQVKLAFKVFYACQQSLEIVTANPTDGSTSPAAGQLLVAVSDGGAPFSDSPYLVEKVALGCFSAMGCGSPAPDDYAFDFSLADGRGAPVRAHMGEVVTLGSGNPALKARNLRSYQSAACDDYWNFAYTIVRGPLVLPP
jgi:hypothetical protein